MGWRGERREIEPLTKFSKGGSLTEPQLLEGVIFFRGGRDNFHIKTKLKSEIFNDKKGAWTVYQFKWGLGKK